MASSSSPPQTHHLALPAPPPSSAVSSRRLPPPCWSHDETAALIDAYRHKWYSLRRGNLRAQHWQEVADAVTAQCPPPSSAGNPSKTAVQCRHKMEKLRKRYRAELQRALTFPKGKRFTSSWVHFNRMDSMEKGSSNSTTDVEVEDDDNDEDDDDEDLYQSVKRGIPHNRAVHRSISNGIGSSGVRIKFSGKSSVPPKIYGKFIGKSYTHVGASPNLASARVVGDGFSKNSVFGKRWGVGVGGEGVGRKRDGEMVAAVKALGDGFVRMERMKMEMAREVEAMRMEMETKRTEMILDSQQRTVEVFAKAFLEKRNKKAKRMPSPEA